MEKDMYTKELDRNHRFTLVICFCFMSSIALAQKHFEEIFRFSDSGIEVYNHFAKIDSNLVIPDTIHAYGKSFPIQHIKHVGFMGVEQLKTIKLPNSLLSIGDYAFEDCVNLESIFIPENVTLINKDAFLNTGLQYAEVAAGNTRYDSRENCNAIIESSTNKLIVGTSCTVIPQSVACIGEKAFFGKKLKSIFLSNSIRMIEAEAFHGCDSLSEVFIEPSSLDDPIGLCAIGEGAFSWCKELDSICLPSTLKSIGDRAFHATSLHSVYIPENVEVIGKNVFGRCSGLEHIKVDAGNKHYDSRKNCNAIIETATGKLISGCNNTIIPAGVLVIGNGAFEGMEGLSNLVIPNGVHKIEERAFTRCENLELIDLPQSLVMLEDCFGGCEKLNKIIVRSRKPPIIYGGDFCQYQKITLCVPKGCLKRYKKSGWGIFGKIVERNFKK